MFVFEFVLAVLAAAAVAECFLHGEIFEVFRGLLNSRFVTLNTESIPLPELDDVNEPETLPLPGWLSFLDRLVPNFFARAWTCPYCIQFHAVALTLSLIGLSWITAEFSGKGWEIASILLKLPVYWWAGARLVQLQDAIMPAEYKFARKDD
jgi:hypothetical protein